MTKSEFTIIDPDLEEIIALYERVTGKKATAQERDDCAKLLANKKKKTDGS